MSHASETSIYGLSPSDMEKAWSSTVCLTSIMTIWPDPRDLLMAGSKLFLETIIQEASSFANFSHPQVSEVEPTFEIVRQITSGQLSAVLKREFSSHGHHILTSHTRDPLAKLKNCLVEEERVYSKTTLFPRPRWYLSPYNPCLRHLGEIRAFVINGVLFMSIITLPASQSTRLMDIVEPILFTPLSRLRLDFSIYLSGQSLFNWLFSLSFEERRSGTHPGLASTVLSPHEEEGCHADYILPLLYRLIVAEEHITKRRSGMRVFVRMDISVFQSKGKFNYVVNELTRSHQSTLFAEYGGGKADFAFQDMTKVLHFITSHDNFNRNILTI
ncbi:MAG: hypothetical protein QOH50_5261 [Kribbellaceae bacterium]|nr:hypothetical protein [Kribbellaceae bacterium]